MATRKAAIVHLTQKDGYLWLTAPYNPEANHLYKILGGKWVPETKVWMFHPDQASDLLSHIENTFGCSLTVGETGIATKGTEYLGKGGFKKAEPFTAGIDTLPDRFRISAGSGLIEKDEDEPSTFQKAQMIAANLVALMPAMSEKEKEEIFLMLFGED